MTTSWVGHNAILSYESYKNWGFFTKGYCFHFLRKEIPRYVNDLKTMREICFKNHIAYSKMFYGYLKTDQISERRKNMLHHF